jgi:hypothetical protein
MFDDDDDKLGLIAYGLLNNRTAASPYPLVARRPDQEGNKFPISS